MMTFKEFLMETRDTNTGNYVQVKQEFPSGFYDISCLSGKVQKDPHITLMYQKESNENPLTILKILNARFKKNGAVKILKASKFDQDEGTAIVLELDAQQLVRIHFHLRSLGLKHSYESYSPHLTLFYNVTDTDEADAILDKINRDSELPGQLILFNGFESTTIIEDWNNE